MDNPKLIDLFVGSALGTFAGDALGMPFEGWSSHEVRDVLRQGVSMWDGRLPRGTYTDDTEMMIGILESIVARGCLDPADTAHRFLTNFSPQRGYGARIYGLMQRLSSGIPWDQVGTDSFGNGSAMRVAPVGFFFYDNPYAIKEAASLSSRITHLHPEGIAGAVAQASAVGSSIAHALRERTINPPSFVKALAELVSPISEVFGQRLRQLETIAPDGTGGLIDALTGRYQCDIRAIEAVPPAIGAFLYTDNFRDAVVTAVSLGGDTDTIGAMTGAVAGAYYGYRQIPMEWLDEMENRDKGRDYVAMLAREAAEILIINKDNKKRE